MSGLRGETPRGEKIAAEKRDYVGMEIESDDVEWMRLLEAREAFCGRCSRA